MADYQIFHVDDLKGYVAQFFQALGVSEPDAQIAADVLVSADIRGINSHGVIRLYSYYGSRLVNGQIDPASPITVINESPSTLALDGGNGLGQVVAHHAMSRCIDMAKETGVAIATVRNSNHYGIAGYYAMMALPEDLIGLSLTNSQPLVAPTFGATPILGTNPIAVAVPAGEEKPYVLDMATSIVSIGRITVYEKSGTHIPKGWGINASGELTEHPEEVLSGGALLPLGGSAEMRGYKGYGLSLLVDLLSGVLAGAGFGTGVGHPSRKNNADVGHFFAAIKVENFRPIAEFKADMDSYIRELKLAPKMPGKDRIYIHGEKEFENAEKYTKEGVPLLTEIVDGLIEAGKSIGIPFDLKSIR